PRTAPRPSRAPCPLLEEDVGPVAGVAGALEEPLPLVGAVEAAAGQLPVEQVDLLALAAEALDGHVLGAARHALDLAERRVELEVLEVVERVDRVDQIERTVRVGQLD